LARSNNRFLARFRAAPFVVRMGWPWSYNSVRGPRIFGFGVHCRSNTADLNSYLSQSVTVFTKQFLDRWFHAFVEYRRATQTPFAFRTQTYIAVTRSRASMLDFSIGRQAKPLFGSFVSLKFMSHPNHQICQLPDLVESRILRSIPKNIKGISI
jgi:hypothetical protein